MPFPYDFSFYLGGEGSTSEELVGLYQMQLTRLLPPGAALNKLQTSNLGSWLNSFSVELARIHERVLDLYLESFPGEASERLDEWEELCGLPDECTYLDTDLTSRRDAVLDKFAVLEGQSHDDFVGLAAEKGYAVTIQIWPVFRTGVQTIGHMPLYSVQWYFAINVTYTPSGNAPEDARMECVLKRHAHAHTRVYFNLSNDYFETHPRS